MSGLSLTDWIRRAVIQEGLRIEVLLLHIKKEPVAWKRLGVTPEELEEVACEREVGLGKWQGMNGWKKPFILENNTQISRVFFFFPRFVLFYKYSSYLPLAIEI